MKNNRLIQALKRQPVDKTPIWIMRQAGRYLPEYRKIREQAGDFITLCKTPELACEVTLQPLRRFALDAAIIFSDILTIPDAMGLDLYFIEGEGPKFKKSLQNNHDIAALEITDPINQFSFLTKAIQFTKKELANSVPLIGFAGSPWTLATYMMENGPSKSFAIIKKFIFNEPKAAHQLLKKLTTVVVDYLNLQITAGVDVVMIFDTWGGILAPDDYQEFSLQYMAEIVHQLKQNKSQVPIILFTKNGGLWLEQIADSGCDAIGLDWTINIDEAKKRVGHKVALQGNMDPAILYAKPTRIRAEVAKILQDYGSGPGHIFNLGHGINPDTPYENVDVLVNAVHELSMNKQKKEILER